MVVFYDEDGDGQAGADEVVRLPGVEVVIGDGTAKTAAGGRAVVQAPLGVQTVALRTESVPAFYQPPAPRPVTVPTSEEILLPLTLPTSERPNVYMAFGDSLTVGEGSSDGEGYRGRLDQQLSSYLGTSEVVNEGRGGHADERRGRPRGPRPLAPPSRLHPHPVRHQRLEHPGLSGPGRAALPDHRRDALDHHAGRRLSAACPCSPPSSPPIPRSTRPSATSGCRRRTAFCSDLARAEGIPLADPATLFFAQSNLPALFSDHVHPNDAGYELIARAFFEAVTGPRSATGATASLFRGSRR